MNIFNSDKQEMMQRIETLETNANRFNELHAICDVRHDQHIEHRRRIDDKIDDLLSTVKQILNVLQDNTPTIDRAKNNFITLDTLKSWSLWIAAISGAITIVYHLLP